MIPLGLLISFSVKWGDKACGHRVFELLTFCGWGHCPPPSHSLCFSSTVRGKPGCAETQQQGGDRGCHAQNPGEWPLVGQCVTLESTFLAACPFSQSWMDGCTLPGPRVHILTPLGDYCELWNRGQRLEWVWCLSSAILPVSCLLSVMCVWWLARQWRRMVKGWTNFSELLVIDQNFLKGNWLWYRREDLLGILKLDMKFQQTLFGQLLEASGCVNFLGYRVHPTPCHTFLYLLGEFATHGNPLLSDSGPWDQEHQNKRTVQFGGGLGIARVYCECVVAGAGVSFPLNWFFTLSTEASI